MKLAILKQLAKTIPETEGLRQQQWLHEQLRGMGMDPNAIYQELEMTSRFVDTHRDVSFSNAHMQLHSHTFYELIYCCSNCGAEYLVGPERYRLQEGDVVFVPPGVSHRPLLPEHMDTPYVRYVVWLSQDFLQQYMGLFPTTVQEKHQDANLLRVGGAARERLGELFLAGVQEAERQQDGWEIAVIGNTIRLLIEIKRATDAHSAHTMKSETPELLDRITAFVEENYASAITINDLAKRFFVSSSTLSHLFKKKLGVSFYRYVTQRRLIAAKTLIEKGLLLETVAARTGFSDYSGFYRAFRQEFGISPRKYRSLQEIITKSPTP